MQPIPQNLLTTFDAVLKQRNIPIACRSDYRKWARYFFDFQKKYAPREDKATQVKLFADKLRSKGQTALQIEQAADAVSLLFTAESERKPYALPAGAESAGPKTNASKNQHERIEVRNPSAGSPEAVPVCEALDRESYSRGPRRGGKKFDEWRCLRKSESPEWDEVVALLADEIRTRHYSRKTLKHYADWSRKFQSYLKHKDPDRLSSSDVKAYLT